MKQVCVTFAGAVGSSKTPITNYISTKLDLPVFNNDAIRSEVIEDMGGLVEEEYLKRRDERLREIIQSKKSFILDASVDRVWDKLKENLKDAGYEVFIISLDLSKDLLSKLYIDKKYFDAQERVDSLINDHELFLENHREDINLHLKDEDFGNRLEKSYMTISEWIER
jgi:hypothetical protein